MSFHIQETMDCIPVVNPQQTRQQVGHQHHQREEYDVQQINQLIISKYVTICNMLTFPP
jgi:hypothetical protein